MEDQFIKLKVAGQERYIYIRPQDIRCAEWDFRGLPENTS